MEKWQAQCVLFGNKIDIIPCATDGFNAVLEKSGFGNFNSCQKPLSAQPVDATLSNDLIHQCFP